MTTPRRLAGRALELLLVVVAVSLVLGQLLGQPVVLGYVETGSMRPTIAPGDGFVAVPAQLTSVEVGDIVVYRPELVSGGRLTTHRVVAVTPDGYVTRGDANTRTDQAGNEPPVRPVQVVAEVLQVDGHAVVVPGLGTAVGGLRGVLDALRGAVATATGGAVDLDARTFALSLFVLGALGYVASSLAGSNRRRRTSRATATLAPRTVVLALTALVVLSSTAAMVSGGGVRTYDLVSADIDAPGARVVPHGTSETTVYPVTNAGYLPTVSYLSSGSPALAVSPDAVAVGPGQTVNATVTLSAPRENGYYREYLVEHRYLAVVPRGLLDVLYAVHPWLALAAVDATVGGAFLAVAALLLGVGDRGVRRHRRTHRRPHRNISLRRLLLSLLRRLVGRIT